MQLNIFEVEHVLMKKLPKRERETIISFNEADETANVFTYNRRWQRHIQDRLGIAPYQVTEFGGRYYELPKKAITKPSIRKRQNLTPVERARRRDRLSRMRAQMQDSSRRIDSDKGPGVDSTRSKRRARGSGDGGGPHH